MQITPVMRYAPWYTDLGVLHYYNEYIVVVFYALNCYFIVRPDLHSLDTMHYLIVISVRCSCTSERVTNKF